MSYPHRHHTGGTAPVDIQLHWGQMQDVQMREIFTGRSPLPINEQIKQMNQENELCGLNAQHKHIAQHEERISMVKSQQDIAVKQHAAMVEASENWVNSQRAQQAQTGASTAGNIQGRAEIPKALDLLVENVATLEKMLTELEQRLAPVLQAPYPEQETEAVLKTSDIPMVNTLTHGVVSIKRMQDHVANIIGRLAL